MSESWINGVGLTDRPLLKKPPTEVALLSFRFHDIGKALKLVP
jgi:hypothetical protein